VVATGTRFEVNLDDQHEVVTLAEGRIVVYANPVEGEHAMQPEARAAQQLVPGEQVLMAAGWVSPPTRVDLRSVEAWKRGQIEAENLPLADVVREFNRYAERPIRIEGRELAATRLSGVFNVRDEASLLAFLHAGLGVEGVSDTHGLLLRSRGAITGSPNTEVE
jgi:transmembrane sensor